MDAVSSVFPGVGHDERRVLSAFFFPQTKNLDFRRKWDKDEYEKLAEKRLTEEREKKDGGYLLKDGGYLLHQVLTLL